jgi:hypothetical protein
MTEQRNSLFELLPAYLRDRDLRADGLLEEITDVIARQANAFEEDLAHMYADCFIETCSPWVIPYIADLLGANVTETGSGGASRRAIANLLASRRRRGSMAAVTGLARAVAGWRAEAREMYRLLSAVQHLDYIREDRPGTVANRSARSLEEIEPWGAALVGDVRNGDAGDSSVPADVTGLALAARRIRAFTVTGTRAYAIENHENAFTFSVLGNDTQLFDPRQPGPITRLALEKDAGPDDQSATADPDLYGEGKAITIWADGWPNRRPSAEQRIQPIPPDAVIPADLSNWAYKVPKGHIALDPVLGRILFPLTQGPSRGTAVRVKYHYGFAMELGGGEYRRPPMPMPAHVTRSRVHSRETGPPPDGDHASIVDAITAWRTKRELQEGSPETASDPTAFPALVVELMESGLYSGALDVDLDANESIWIVAAPGTRPVLWLSDVEAGAPDALNVRGRHGSRFVMDGVMLAGRGLRLAPADDGDDRRSSEEDLCEVLIRHCTLVPGWGITHDCEPLRPADPSIVLDGTRLCLRVENSIIGKIDISLSAVTGSPARIAITDSIVDATAARRTAIGSADATVGYARLTVARSTIVGAVAVHAIDLAEDTIFNGEVIVARRQQGCVRYSFVRDGSRVPRQFRCQPAMARSAVRPEASDDPDDMGLRSRRLADVIVRIAPHSVSLRYGSPEYMRLSLCTPEDISRGASDGGEMGVYHNLFEPRRLDQLQARLVDHSPADFDSVVMFAS